MNKEDFDIHEKQDLEGVEKKWKKFQEENDISKVEDVDLKHLKEEIEKDLGYVSKMTVQEYTLFQKWQEVHRKYPTVETTTLYGTEKLLENPTQKQQIESVRKSIWIPESPEDYDKLEPVLEYTDDTTKRFNGKAVRTQQLSENWNTLRTFLSTMKNNSNIGRQLFFNVNDNRSGKHLGVICISGDFMDLTPRDSAIGWDRHSKTFGGMINHTAIGSSIVPTQPLGYSFTGGKLLAYLCLSDDVQKIWQEKYGDKLVGVTTTSLYGKAKANTLSQYDGLKYTELTKLGEYVLGKTEDYTFEVEEENAEIIYDEDFDDEDDDDDDEPEEVSEKKYFKTKGREIKRAKKKNKGKRRYDARKRKKLYRKNKSKIKRKSKIYRRKVKRRPNMVRRHRN
jgi:hypothetical protein